MGKEGHACCLVMEGCSAVEYCAAGAKLGESLKCVARCCSKAKLCFLKVIVQPAVLPGGRGSNVNAVVRISDRGRVHSAAGSSLHSNSEPLNLPVLFRGRNDLLTAAAHPARAFAHLRNWPL